MTDVIEDEGIEIEVRRFMDRLDRQTVAKLVKPGDRDEELIATNGQNFVTQSRIDSLPVGHKRGMRNIGLLRMAPCRADRRSAECSLLPPESKVTLRDWSSER